MGLEFRLLRADEIDCRISQCNEYGVQILLYKDARCDQNILDETVGAMNWQRKHTRDNANCIVSIWDEGKKQWVEKEDTGTESFTEAEKGLASDSFKRACFNWGIGRELYTAPQMFVQKKNLDKHYETNLKWTCRDSFKVTDIGYEDNKIVYVKILNTKNNVPIIFGKNPNTSAPEPAPKVVTKKEADVASTKISKEKVDALASLAVKDGVPLSRIVTLYKVADIESMTEKQHKNCMDNWDKIVEMK
jgi:hypothetical protein